MERDARELTILHGKFEAYLSWSQPFLHDLIAGLDAHVRNVVLCSRVENLDRFPIAHLCRVAHENLISPARALLTAARLQRDWRPHVLHAHFGWSGLRMLLLKHFLRVPLVTTFGGRDATVELDLPHFDRLYAALFECSDRIVCVSESLRRVLLAHGADPERVEVVRRGVRADLFPFAPPRARAPREPLRVLMVGRLVQKKGHRLALEALACLAREGRELRLRVIGEGDRYAEVAALRRDLDLRAQVEFSGVTPRDQVYAAMRESDVLLHCAITGSDGDSEGLPNALVEAAATGLPIVATRHGGITEVFEHRRTALLADEGDVAGVAGALRELATNTELRRALGRAAASHVREHFDASRQVKRYCEIYRSLAEAHRPGALAGPAWKPAEYSTEVRAAFASVRAGTELSVAKLFELALRREPGYGTRVEARGWFDRAYDLKRYVPQSLKFPIKAAIGRALGPWLERRASPVAANAVDERVLDRFSEDPNLARIDPGWSEAELAHQIGAERPAP
jgi:colanic acid/amylovoran biosynthesis glycosyltransferase